ncbi:MAG: hypothetical protein KAH23_05160, partial [Kiritimatiellae bacterium]|nr:hypothetical protein [Kiritimatiellia bacterium]
GLQTLRNTWWKKDWPETSSEYTGVVIDPDIIGPDDFRNPLPKAKDTDTDGPFDIWLRRRRWVDSALKKAKAHMGTNLGIDGFYSLLQSSVTYEEVEESAWKDNVDLEWITGMLRTAEQSGDENDLSTINEETRLSIENVNRLVEIWRVSKTLSEWTDQEQDDLVSIAVQAQKETLDEKWRKEEQDNKIDLSSEYFWRPLKEPKEGVWPPKAGENTPFIDPDEVSLKEVPEITVGLAAKRLWEKRFLQLKEKLEELFALRNENERQNRTAEDVLNKLFFHTVGDWCSGVENDGQPVGCLDKLHELNQAMLTDPESVETTLNSELKISADEFSRLMNLISKYDPQKPAKTLNEQEWRDLFDILVRMWRHNVAYREWAEEERSHWGTVNVEDAEFAYWQAIKAAIPKWRATIEARRAWIRALEAVSEQPLIDPDLVDKEFCRETTVGGLKALLVLEDRAMKLEQLIEEPITNINVAGQSQALLYFDAILTGGLFSRTRWESVGAQIEQSPVEIGIEIDAGEDVAVSTKRRLVQEFILLVEAREAGETIISRLQQLGLSYKGFNYLADKRAFLAAADGEGLLSQDEWMCVYEILAQSQKIRRFSQWRKKERDDGISLTPDIFVLSKQSLGTGSDTAPAPLNTWRASYADYLEWKDKLQARVDQEKEAVLAYWQMVGDVEGETLPSLRDALIEASIEDANITGLEKQREYLSKELLIDLTESGCQVTTRVVQAITTIQSLLGGLQSKNIGQSAAGLRLVADNFEAEWKWLGSYATWRAAMFVFLYPENILIPSLRRHQTPAFRQLVDGLRSNRRLTPDTACTLAKEYESYYKDIVNLRLEVTCHARVMTYEGSSCKTTSIYERKLLFLFGMGPATETVYWSAIDPEQEKSGYQQRFWEAVPGLEKTHTIIGVQPYAISEEERFIYLFV